MCLAMSLGERGDESSEILDFLAAGGVTGSSAWRRGGVLREGTPWISSAKDAMTVASHSLTSGSSFTNVSSPEADCSATPAFPFDLASLASCLGRVMMR
jgi:hypothetical protein